MKKFILLFLILCGAVLLINPRIDTEASYAPTDNVKYLSQYIAPGGNLATAISAIGSVNSTTLIYDVASATSAPLTITSNIHSQHLKGCVITVPIASGYTLTVAGPITAGPYQIYSAAAGGEVVFGPGSVEEVYGEWWGASEGAPGAVNSAAFQAALDSILYSARKPALKLLNSSYTIATGLTVTIPSDYQKSGITIKGTVGLQWIPHAAPPAVGSRFYYTGAGTALKIGDGATPGYVFGASLRDFNIAGTSSAAAGLDVAILSSNLTNMTISGFTGGSASGILFAGFGNKVTGVAATGNAIGMSLGRASGAATTINTFDNCSWVSNYGKGVYDVQSQHTIFLNNIFNSNGDSGYEADATGAAGAVSVMFEGGYFEYNNITVAGYALSIKGYDATYRYERPFIKAFFNTGGAAAIGHIYISNTAQCKIDSYAGDGGAIAFLTQVATNTGLIFSEIKTGAYQWSTWTPSDIAGTFTNAPVTAITSAPSAYYTMTNASGTLSLTFTTRGKYLITADTNLHMGAVATTVTASFTIGTSVATCYVSYPSRSVTSALSDNPGVSNTFLVSAVVGDTVTVLPRIAVTQSGGNVANYIGTAYVIVTYMGL